MALRPTENMPLGDKPIEGIEPEAAKPEPEAANEVLAAKPEATNPEAAKPDQVATPETPKSAIGVNQEMKAPPQDCRGVHTISGKTAFPEMRLSARLPCRGALRWLGQ